jgi:hypothetical protein
MRLFQAFLVFCVLVSSFAGRSTAANASLELRDDLNVHHRTVTTGSVEAQRWFDQGLVLYFGFNHEAAIAFFQRADLALHPGNGWAIHGLAECLRRTGRAEEAADVDRRFESAWARADIEIKGSCYCRTRFN